MKKNKIIAITIAILSCMSISSVSVSAESVVTTPPVPISNEFIVIGEAEESTTVAILKSGQCGDNATWTLDKNMTLTISGTGDMYDFVSKISKSTGTVITTIAYYTVPWKDYSSNIKSIVIDDGITHIGDLSFLDCSNVNSIIIPSSVTSIGNNVFSVNDYYDSYRISQWYRDKKILLIPPSVTVLPDKFYSGNRIIVCASNSEVEICAILNGIPYVTIPFDENNNPILSIEEIEEAVYQKGIEEGIITTAATTMTYNPNYPVVTYDQYDCNRDGVVNLIDLLSLKKRLFGLI